MTSPRPTTPVGLSSEEPIFIGGGEMGALTRAFPWSETEVGAMDTWPPALRTMVGVLLASRHPMFLWWGPGLVQFYNDAYRPSLGRGKHPRALGQAGRECWPEIWDVIGPQIDAVMLRGEATWHEDQLIPIERNGTLQDVYWTYGYSPVRDDRGAVGGVLVVVTDTTSRVIGEHRTQLLHRLADCGSGATSVAELCARVEAVLASALSDMPFSLVYLRDTTEPSARRVSKAGTPTDPAMSPDLISLVPGYGEAGTWPLATVALSGVPQLVEDIAERFGLAGDPGDPGSSAGALVVPIGRPGESTDGGFLIAGLDPRRPVDDDLRGFLRLVADQLASAVSSVRAAEADRERAEALTVLDGLKSAFFTNVSHEFRTPLTLMLGPVEEALADEVDTLPQAQRVRLEIVRRNSLRLLRLVNQLLDFSRIESGRLVATFRPVDVAALTRDSASTFEPAMDQAGLRLVINCPAPVRQVFVDADMWERITLNLVSNAFKHTFEGEIEVSLLDADTTVQLRVRDTGTGIPESEMPRLFERFHRVEGSMSRTHEGTGIGLSLVQELVWVHGGTVSVESVVGSGSTFVVTIPTGSGHLPPDRVSGPSLRPSGATQVDAYGEEAMTWLLDRETSTAQSQRPLVRLDGPAPTLADGRVLIVDDNTDMRAHIASLLGRHCIVETAANGRSALDAVLASPPDLIVCDVAMPDMDGPMLVRALRQHAATRLLPVILVSARADEDALVAGLEAGADDYLVKPFSARELVARVSAHLKLSQERARALDLRDAFVGFVSHELRTPITTIYGASAMLSRNDLSDAVRAGLTADIVAEADRMWRLVEDMMVIARSEVGQVVGRDEPVLVSHIASKVVRAESTRSLGREIALRVEPYEPAARGDEGFLEQVIRNLISNALKYAPAGPPIEVVVRADTVDPEVQVLVLDRGMGVPEDEVPHLFEMFYRTPAATRSASGAGIGLYVCRRLVQELGGRIWFQPRPGGGSEFGFAVPRYMDGSVDD